MINLLICRHGEASFDADSDFNRQLTAKGRKDAYRLGHDVLVSVFDQCELSQSIPIRGLVSPYLRTQQTYQQLTSASEHYHWLSPLNCEELIPTTQTRPAIDCLYQQSQLEPNTDELLVVVSHMPLVAYLLADLVDGDTGRVNQYPMQPASAMLLTGEVIASGCLTVKAVFHPDE